MRKTRLVILPTKCLHQMGFLLLFLSCPVIGDWGRIRPDNENLQKAIEVEREGTCGLQRDTPGGFVDLSYEKGLNIRRLREDNDLNRIYRFEERRDTRRATGNRFDIRRERSVEFRRADKTRRERDVQERSIRSRSAEPRRNERNAVRARSLSLSRLEASRRQSRREGETDRRDKERRLSLARRMNEKESERRVEQREDERAASVQNERMRSSQRRLNERSVQRLSLQRREDDIRRQDRNIREETERRLSLSRTEEISRNMHQSESTRSTGRGTLERRLPKIRKSRNIRNERERTIRAERDMDNRWEVDLRKLAVKSDRNIREERRLEILNRRVEKTRRMSAGMNHQNVYPEGKTESFFTGPMKWINLEHYEIPTIGDWSTNCVIGAVAYYLSTRQAKTV